MKNLKRAFGSPNAEFHDRVRQTLFLIEEREEARKKKKLTFSMALAFALCICIIAVSAFAGAGLLTRKPDVTQRPLSHGENPGPSASATGTPDPLATAFSSGTPAPTFPGETEAAASSLPQPATTSIPQTTAQPQSEAAPDPTESSEVSYNADYDLVYYSNDQDGYYHAAPQCVRNAGMMTAAAEEVHLSMGRTACPLCVNPDTLNQAASVPDVVPDPDLTYYHTDENSFFHTDMDCSDMKAPAAASLSVVVAAGKDPCPLCLHDWWFVSDSSPFFHCVNGCYGNLDAVDKASAFVAQWEKTACPVCVKPLYYFYPHQTDYFPFPFFHTRPDCPDMTEEQAVPGTYVQAVIYGKEVCPTCADGLFYCTVNGVSYHSFETCSGMSAVLAEPITAQAVSVLGKPACRVCLSPDTGPSHSEQSDSDRETNAQSDAVAYSSSNYSDLPDDPVYTSLEDAYYHTLSSCYKAADPSETSVRTAIGNSRHPCPVCTTALLPISNDPMLPDLYHLSPDCEALTDGALSVPGAVLADDALPCPFCVLYTSPEDDFIHQNPYCSEALSIQACSYGFAMLSEKPECPVCYSVDDSVAVPLAGQTTATSVTVDTHASSASSIVYLWDSDAPVYHAILTCSGFEYLAQTDVDKAIAEGRIPCPECVNADHTVWFSETGEYYHSCQHLPFVDPKTVCGSSPEDALTRGKRPCPNCMLTSTAKTDASSAIGRFPPAWSTGDAACFFYDYATSSTHFHPSADCAGLIAPVAVSRETVLRYGALPCPDCAASLNDSVCIAKSDGKAYHLSDACAELSSPEFITLWDAKIRSLEPCPSCAVMDAVSAVPASTVPPRPTMPPADDPEALKAWMLSEEEQAACLADLGLS